MRIIALTLLAAGSLAGCATVPTTAVVDGQTVPRLDLDFTGQPYLVHHKGAHPRPRGPSSGLHDAGGSIVGQVCGMDIDYDVRHDGDHVQLVGQLDGQYPSQIQVRDQAGERVITGTLGPIDVDVHLRSDALYGHVGIRRYLLQQDGDVLTGEMALVNTTIPAHATVAGRDALWSMPAADQGAIVATLLTCNIKRIGDLASSSDLHVALGGPAGAMPAQSSAIYQDTERLAKGGSYTPKVPTPADSPM